MIEQAQREPRVVIVGGGFGGLYAAKALRRARVHITLIDRANFHLFQPLLYEVATAALSPADIAAPIRKVFSRHRNVTALMGEVTSIDSARRIVHLKDGQTEYDYLIVATGATHSYFGNETWARHAPGLKTVEDALEIRRRFLLAFEAAEREADAEARRAKLTFVIVGAGPTGVELAGTMSELAHRAIPRDFRAIDTTTARVVLVEALDRVLPALPRDLSANALRALQRLGVEVRLNSRVTAIDSEGVAIGSPPDHERIDAVNVIWAAGVQASPLGARLGAPTDKHGRVIVNSDLTIPNHPEVFVVGDLAHVVDPISGREVPGVAPAAIQMGRYVGWIIKGEVSRVHGERVGDAQTQAGSRRRPFHYRDKGLLATIGRGKAVGYVGKVHVRGTIAWLLWVFVHIMYLIGFRNRFIVMLQWAWTYLAWQRGARLITGTTELELRRPRTDSVEIVREEAPAMDRRTAAAKVVATHDGERS